MQSIISQFPFIIAWHEPLGVAQREVAGYAYASQFKERAAYR
jgi:L-amino acid N-acyltransferase YncA